MSNEQQTLEPSKPTGGTFSISVPVVIPLPWYRRFWRWIRRKPTFDVIHKSTISLSYNDNARAMQAALISVDPSLRGNVRVEETATGESVISFVKEQPQ